MSVNQFLRNVHQTEMSILPFHPLVCGFSGDNGDITRSCHACCHGKPILIPSCTQVELPPPPPGQLLDICRRLDAMESNGFPDGLDEAEAAALRVLISVCCVGVCNNVTVLCSSMQQCYYVVLEWYYYDVWLILLFFFFQIAWQKLQDKIRSL